VDMGELIDFCSEEKKLHHWVKDKGSALDS
jgi:hypothetical protein